MPPTIVRQGVNPQPKTKPPPSTGSAWDMVDSIRMLLYGESGTGKTTLWATFPGPILALICSGGDKPGELRSIDTPEYRRKITPKVIRTSDEFDREVRSAANWGTVVLDHASGFADMKLSEIIGRPTPAQKGWGLATQQQYGQLSLQCKEAFRMLLNMPCNVVIVAQQRTFGGKDDGIDPELIKPTVGAALTPSVTGWLNPACDYVVQTFKRPRMVRKVSKVNGKEIAHVERDKGVEYCLRCEPHDVFMTKFRVPKGRTLPDVIVDPDYSKVLAAIRGS